MILFSIITTSSNGFKRKVGEFWYPWKDEIWIKGLPLKDVYLFSSSDDWWPPPWPSWYWPVCLHCCLAPDPASLNTDPFTSDQSIIINYIMFWDKLWTKVSPKIKCHWQCCQSMFTMCTRQWEWPPLGLVTAPCSTAAPHTLHCHCLTNCLSYLTAAHKLWWNSTFCCLAPTPVVTEEHCNIVQHCNAYIWHCTVY